MALNPEQRRKNLRMAIALLSIALVFGLGFVAKALMFGV
jgi:hypothetical protein